MNVDIDLGTTNSALAYIDPQEAADADFPPIEVFLPPHTDGSREEIVPVTLESNVTETGLLELWCVAADGRRWKLEFNVRERAAA